MNLNCEAIKDHLKFVETLMNNGIEVCNICTAQIYAQTFIYIDIVQNKKIIIKYSAIYLVIQIPIGIFAHD